MAEPQRGEAFRLCPAPDVVRAALGEGGLPRAAHAGLVFDRYLPLWQGAPQAPERTELGRPLRRFAEEYRRGAGPERQALLASAHRRQRWALESLRGCEGGQHEEHTLTVDWRLIHGLGGVHASECGFAFDATIGVPVLNGSAIKGLCRAAAGLLGAPVEQVEEIFGPERISEDGDAARGDVAFLDAYPERWPDLAVDVMNCHHPSYYDDLGRDSMRANEGPPETEDPNPVYFLSVDAGTTFVFRLRSRSGQHASRAMTFLQQGLATIGIGAKTAVGYGVLSARK